MARKTSSEDLPNQGIHSNDFNNDAAAEGTISPTVPFEFDTTSSLQSDDTAPKKLLTWNARTAFEHWVPSTPNDERKRAGARSSTSLYSPKKKQKAVKPEREMVWVNGHFRKSPQKSRTGSSTGTQVKNSLFQEGNVTAGYKASRSRGCFSDQSASSNGARKWMISTEEQPRVIIWGNRSPTRNP